MGNSLLDIKPHQVSKNLRGYSVLLYGPPKTGKTATASHFPGALLVAFEKGYNALPGVMAKPVNSWNEFRKVLTELKDEEVKKIFQTVIIDTGDIAYEYVKKYICDRESTATVSYENIGDIPYGKGYALAQSEFDECLRKILQMDYGLVVISHDTDKTMKNEAGQEYSQIVPTLDPRARLVCERTCDIIGYARIIDTDEGQKTKLFLRGTTRFIAGSRFRYTPDVIDFTYENLVNAISEAVKKEENLSGGTLVTEENHTAALHADEPEYDFKALMDEFQTVVGQLMQKNSAIAPKITAIVDKYLGKGKKVGDCTEAQASQIDLIVFELKKLLN